MKNINMYLFASISSLLISKGLDTLIINNCSGIDKYIQIILAFLAAIISPILLKILHAKFPFLFDRSYNRHKLRRSKGLK